MTRVDFYILPQSTDEARWQFTCRLIEKAWRMGNKLLVHTADNQAARTMDELLWAFRPDSFLPHAVLPATHQTPIHIGYDEHNGQHHDLLINLGTSIPGVFSRFERVAEIVTQQPEQLTASRERFRFYKERGYALQTHHLNPKS